MVSPRIHIGNTGNSGNQKYHSKIFCKPLALFWYDSIFGKFLIIDPWYCRWHTQTHQTQAIACLTIFNDAHTHSHLHCIYSIRILCQMLHYMCKMLPKIDDTTTNICYQCPTTHAHTMKMNATIINLSDRNIWLSLCFGFFPSIHFRLLFFSVWGRG